MRFWYKKSELEVRVGPIIVQLDENHLRISCLDKQSVLNPLKIIISFPYERFSLTAVQQFTLKSTMYLP